MKSEKTRDTADALDAQSWIVGDSQTGEGVVSSLCSQGELTFDEHHLAGLRSGDKETTRRFERHFRPLLRLKLWGRVNWKREDDLIDEVISATIEGIRRDELRDALRLPGYVCAVCTRLMRRDPAFALNQRPPKSSSYAPPRTVAHVL